MLHNSAPRCRASSETQRPAHIHQNMAPSGEYVQQKPWALRDDASLSDTRLLASKHDGHQGPCHCQCQLMIKVPMVSDIVMMGAITGEMSLHLSLLRACVT